MEMSAGETREPEGFLGDIQDCVRRNAYKETAHAKEMMHERDITRDEIMEVLCFGRRNPERDRYCEDLKSWSRAIEGHTRDSRFLRVCVVLHRFHGALIVTVYDLNQGEPA